MSFLITNLTEQSTVSINSSSYVGGIIGAISNSTIQISQISLVGKVIGPLFCGVVFGEAENLTSSIITNLTSTNMLLNNINSSSSLCVGTN